MDIRIIWYYENQELIVLVDIGHHKISYYLCYSSQAYFQSVFKKETRITPNECRKKHNILNKNI